MKKYRVSVNGVPYEVHVEVIEDDESDNVSAQSHHPPKVEKLSDLPSMITASEVERITPKSKPKSEGVDQINSPLSGVVHKIHVKSGQRVKWHEVLLEIDAMKMITKIYSPDDGRIEIIHVNEGDSVQTGELLIEYSEEEI